MKQERDYFVEELERAFQPRKTGDGTAFKVNWPTVLLVIFLGIAVAGLALPLYFGHPDPGFTEGLFVPVTHSA